MTDPRLHAVVAAQPYPLLFVTVSGAHLYGFPSPDSDYDLRGVHLLPAREVLGLHATKDTIDSSGFQGDLEVDLVTHDAGKFFGLLLKKNGYVLEQLLSPIVLHTTPAHAELADLAQRGCVTKFHAYHYLGFAGTQWNLFDKERPRRAKPLLYVYRVLLTGIHLMRTGAVEANLLTLNAEYKLPYIDELVARKLAGPEKGAPDADAEFHRGEYDRLVARLREEHERTGLPEQATTKDALSDLLVRLRLRTLGATS